MSRNFYEDWFAPLAILIAAIVITGSAAWLIIRDKGIRSPAAAQVEGTGER